MFCAEFDWNSLNGSEQEDENWKVYRQADRQSDR